MNFKPSYFTSKYTFLLIGFLVGMFWMSTCERTSGPDISLSPAAEEKAPTLWTCSMHPQIKLPKPGKCPICGMDLIPLVEHSDDGSGREITLSEEAKKLAEIQTVPVVRRLAEKTVRLVGKVAYDETRLTYITAWFPGRLDRLFVNFTGTPVRKGDHLAEMYSPDLIADQESLLQAKRAIGQSQSTIPSVQANKGDLLEKARERLRLLGLTDRQIQDFEERESPSEKITFYSPQDGIVIHKNALQGDYVQTGSRIYTIADLSRLWVLMDAYESDLPWIHYGQDVEFTTIAYPGETFHGQVSFIAPFLDDKTRTVKIRVNVDNTAGKLKPDMFINAQVHSSVNGQGLVYQSELAGKWICYMHPEIVKDQAGDCDLCGMPLVTTESLGYANVDVQEASPPIVIPTSAVLITGKRAVVYVENPQAEKPTFEGREIELGPRLDEFYMVRSGLIVGERIVVNGNFKLDSALEILAKPSMMRAEEEPTPSEISSSLQENEMPMDMTMNMTMNMTMDMPMTPAVLSAEQLKDLLPLYPALTQALYADRLDEAKKAANEMADKAEQLVANPLDMFAKMAAQAETLEGVREQFAKISESLFAAIEKWGTPEILYEVFCPMAFNNRGARWIQWSNKEINNPYFGAAMPHCGSVKNTFSPKP